MRPTDFSSLRDFYVDQLNTKIMPFWMKYGIDREKGGIFTGIGDDGTVHTTNKYIWSNARALYTFSALYNYIEKKKEWLETAHQLFDFLAKHGRNERNIWGYLVDRDGTMLEGEKAIQVDAFALMGLAEYIKTTGNQDAVRIARETFRSVTERLAKPGSYGTFPYPIPKGYKAHRDYFQFAFAFFELGKVLGDETVMRAGIEKAETIMKHFRRPEQRGLVEYIGEDLSYRDTPEGRTMVPGHAIESMWFLIHIYRTLGNRKRISEALETIKWSVEKGWDAEWGGIFLGIDIEGKGEPYWKHAEKKIWWVFVEALYALLLSYEQCGEAWCLEWYWKVHDWAFSHFPVKEYGEWTQRLDRQGNTVDTVVALPVKDPFHLPRAFVLCVDVLERLAKKQ